MFHVKRNLEGQGGPYCGAFGSFGSTEFIMLLASGNLKVL